MKTTLKELKKMINEEMQIIFYPDMPQIGMGNEQKEIDPEEYPVQEEEEMEKETPINESPVSFIPLDEKTLKAIWNENSLTQKKEIFINFLNDLENEEIKKQYIQQIQKLTVPSLVDAVASNLYLHAHGLGAGKGSSKG